MNPALRVVRGVTGTVLSVAKVSVEWLPGLVLHRQRPVTPDITGAGSMADDKAALHVVTGQPCARCGAAISADAPVRTLKKGLVHDTCPA